MRWAVIGASRIAAGHVIEAIRAQDGFEVAAVVSSDGMRGREFAQANGIPRQHHES